jgi:hypothetical protein
MEIKTKFDIGEEVYFMYNDKITSDVIDNIQYSIYVDGSGGLKYRLKKYYNNGNHMYKKENEIFKNKEELVKFLLV